MSSGWPTQQNAPRQPALQDGTKSNASVIIEAFAFVGVFQEWKCLKNRTNLLAASMRGGSLRSAVQQQQLISVGTSKSFNSNAACRTRCNIVVIIPDQLFLELQLCTVTFVAACP